jgi:flavin-dependent dehydrogenase
VSAGQLAMSCDVIVVGGGPAGFATAIGCAEAGLRVYVLDRSTFPRSCVGETAHPGVEPLFERLGIAEDVTKAQFVRHTGIWMRHGLETEFVRFGGTTRRPWRGFQLYRPEFDQILMNRARKLGVRFVEGCVPTDANSDTSGVAVVTNMGSFGGKVLVDGTGRNRWLARRWRLKVDAFSPRLIARFGYWEGECVSKHDNPTFTSRRDGWDWLARLKPNLYQWVSLNYREQKRGLSAVPAEIAKLRQIGRLRGADVTWSLVRRPASSAYFLVGDAAAVLDPSSSHGILRALSSGILAAKCIARIIKGGSSDVRGITAGYDAWQRDWFLKDVNRLRMLTHAVQPTPAVPR